MRKSSFETSVLRSKDDGSIGPTSWLSAFAECSALLPCLFGRWGNWLASCVWCVWLSPACFAASELCLCAPTQGWLACSFAECRRCLPMRIWSTWAWAAFIKLLVTASFRRSQYGYLDTFKELGLGLLALLLDIAKAKAKQSCNYKKHDACHVACHMFTRHNVTMSHVACHMSHVTCHMPHATCHHVTMSHVT